MRHFRNSDVHACRVASAEQLEVGTEKGVSQLVVDADHSLCGLPRRQSAVGLSRARRASFVCRCLPVVN